MDACSECLANELQAKHLLPRHPDQRVFLTSQWSCVPQLGYVVYRMVVALGICVWISIDFFREGAKFYSENMSLWMIFATNWGFLILTVTSFIQAVGAICHYLNSRKKESTMEPAGLAVMFFWIIYNIAANVALIVTFAYYTFLSTIDTTALGFMNTPMSITKHTLNSCYILCDLFICAIPIRLLHMIYPISIGVIYVVFNAIYFNAGGVAPDGKTYTYHIMDWDQPFKATSSSALGVVLTAFMQFILYGVYRLRIYMLSCTQIANIKNSTAIEQGKDVEDVVMGSVIDITPDDVLVVVTSEQSPSRLHSDETEQDKLLTLPEETTTTTSSYDHKRIAVTGENEKDEMLAPIATAEDDFCDHIEIHKHVRT